MKIVTWNCNGALRKKFGSLLDFQADLYVIQECENPVESNHPGYKKWAENHLWIGDSKNKGIGVFANSNTKIERLFWPDNFKNQRVKHFLPFRLNQENDFLAVWTHRNNSPNFGYIGQFWKYFQLNKNNLTQSLILGDFNSNSIWDEWDIWWNHSDVVKELEEIGLESFYHKLTCEPQGKETIPTLFFQRNMAKPYHIDYVFGAKKFTNGIKKFEIGSPDLWLNLSDHMPIFFEVEGI